MVLNDRERALLGALAGARGRVLSRAELAARAGFDGLSARRVDAVIVALRRALGQDAIVTVRGRGWMLSQDADVDA